MSELTEEDKELLEKMSKQIKKDKGELKQETKEVTQKTAKELTEEYYKEKPDKRPYLRKKRDALKKMRAENKAERAEEKRIYKEAYRKTKKKAIKSRAKRKAGERFGYTTVEKITGSTKRLPSTPKKRKKTIPKARSIRPREMHFEDVLGSFRQPTTKQKRTTQPDYNPHIDFGSGIGNIGQKKKQKPIDPFEKLF